MDDIAGLKWTSTPANGQKPANANYSAFSALRPSPPLPASGRASPLTAPSSQPQSKSTTPANDSFANLVPFGPNSNKNVSLLEQQKRLAETKLRQQQTQTQVAKDQYAGGDEQFWSNLGSGRGTPVVDNTKNITTSSGTGAVPDGDDDDLFAAFNKPATTQNASVTANVPRRPTIEEDDDPFGLSESGRRRTGTAATESTMDDDDVLGLLGKPASAHRAVEVPPPQPKNDVTEMHPQDKAIAELVDMGFPADKAQQALEATESGMDVQAAVGWLLNQAHEEARQKAQSRDTSRHGAGADSTQRNRRPEPEAAATRMRWDEEQMPRNRQQGQASSGDKDFEKMAAELGSNFLKTAGSLWKQGTKKVQQAVQDLNSDSEPSSQPKWMREGEKQQRPSQRSAGDDEAAIGRSRRRSPDAQRVVTATDEALMLESSRPAPPTRPSASSRPDRPERRFDSSADSSRDHSPALPSRLRETLPQKQPAFMRPQNPPQAVTSRSTLNKAVADEQAAQAYVSSARRRKPQPAGQPPVATSEPDLLDGSFKRPTSSQAPTASRSTPVARPQPVPVPRTETPVRRPPPSRNLPAVSAIKLEASRSHREKGNEHFKRGDYSSAHDSYATSLFHLPESHPLVIVLLTNRALTALKTGQPKSAISDADKALSVIGSSKGESETIDFGNGDTPKPMREYYGKALMRKAEALEQMEKWADAALVWREAVEGGHGGATSIQGRLRAEKAAQPKPPAAIAVKKPAGTLRRPVTTAPVTQAAAVSRLRAANAAAEKADDERFRLSDTVDARIQAWRGGKADNLRALLGSLENVLWEGSGWKKISMADLVLPGKVKVQYMKGIAKVHPDKIPTDATTEQRMIAGAVFSTLNEAWDKFKTENGL
ncbi:auxilin-like clathrin-binding protein required for normal clathrin function [Elasticomyces elasticus]|uniref:Auxilin-like clathrin-binding protein required for normal clathrin function n=1 Tax=Exophiala sideris TaxID=1016849 RepID=A0ABR0JNI5_9EURO|nr:auxilin-like clathrin-binding protein required for normal clathrin function [Elasticomyces elasticus]KAK5037808.1 auxilin-like clathrin-binding protein required for normal clathrin function [Exophiala sideris]KAK5043791.1 auxilin-like clathrin-binding protein required for normal clathrin function [Exophiala sideris]KAK5067290.1 auxilin-like clathrin-binding protein required for normal clathrin function [Exophiala sideris]KAK5182623.1 auxilin-like clathrin-binding protein required for normal 